MGEVGKEVRRLREAKGWGQTKLAAAADMAVSGVSQIENGHRNPNSATLIKLARALGVEVADLFPKAPSSSLEPSLFNGIEGERRTPDEFEQALARVLEPVRTEALREKQAANRFLASGQPQDRVVDLAEAEAAKRFVDEFSPEEQRGAFGEVALGYARHERDNTELREALTRAEKVLRQRDQKIAQLEEENAQLREERERVEAEKA